MTVGTVVEERTSYTFEVARGKFGGELVGKHDTVGHFGGVAKGGVLYVEHVRRRTSYDRSKQ